jgi:primosomal protein N'
MCNSELVSLRDISISSLKEMIQKQLTEKGVFTLTAGDLSDIHSIINQLKEFPITIATPIVLNPFFKNIFDSIIYFRPESIFGMNEFSTGEMIFSMVSDLKELIKDRGSIDIFSVFHFHYSLKLINREEEFFNRELKYRKWFLLPPYYNVYALEVKAGDLRTLGAEMRSVYLTYRDILNIKQIYLFSRKKIRGKFKGQVEIHASPQTIKKTDLLKRKNMSIKIVAI